MTPVFKGLNALFSYPHVGLATCIHVGYTYAVEVIISVSNSNAKNKRFV